MKREQKEVNVTKLMSAVWNPRLEAELKPDNPAMAELIESVKAKGIIQPIVVWDDGSPTSIVIAGNRRFAAALAVGLESVPAVVYTDITEVEAREITRIENEVRLGINPLMDANLVKSMLDLGYTETEIAAHFGVPESKICRRVKLLNLCDEIREFAVANPESITVSALEKLALYSADAQVETVGTIGRLARQGKRVGFCDIRWVLNSLSNDIDRAPFNKDECAQCPDRTGAIADFFESPVKGLGHCLKCECYRKKLDEVMIGTIREDVGISIPLIDAENEADVENEYEVECVPGFTRSKSKKSAAVWWWRPRYGANEPQYIYGPTVEEYKRIVAKIEKEERDREEAARKRAEAEREIREKTEALRQERADDREDLAQMRESTGEVLLKATDRLDDKAIRTALNKKLGKSIAEFIAPLIASRFEYRTDVEFDLRAFEVFPELMKPAKITDKHLKAYRDAVSALEKFDAQTEKLVKKLQKEGK